jgi:hypothetical protein
MRLQIFTLFILLSVAGRSQKIERQVITGSGAYLVKPGLRVSFTIGELVITTSKNNQVVLTQGFQQPVTAAVSAPLPVQLVYFTGAMKDGKTQLEWKTAQEYNTDRFEVERSANGTHFGLLTSVTSKGNSSTSTLYQAVDPVPYSPLTYYRLKIVDKDQQFVYSPVVIVKKDLVTGVSLFPNPAVNFVAVSFNMAQKATDTWQLTALNGQQVAVKQVVLQQGLNTVQWPVGHLPQGAYILRSVNNIFPALQFIKQ